MTAASGLLPATVAQFGRDVFELARELVVDPAAPTQVTSAGTSIQRTSMRERVRRDVDQTWTTDGNEACATEAQNKKGAVTTREDESVGGDGFEPPTPAL